MELGVASSNCIFPVKLLCVRFCPHFAFWSQRSLLTITNTLKQTQPRRLEQHKLQSVSTLVQREADVGPPNPSCSPKLSHTPPLSRRRSLTESFQRLIQPNYSAHFAKASEKGAYADSKHCDLNNSASSAVTTSRHLMMAPHHRAFSQPLGTLELLNAQSAGAECTPRMGLPHPVRSNRVATTIGILKLGATNPIEY